MLKDISSDITMIVLDRMIKEEGLGHKVLQIKRQQKLMERYL
jgi:hypothetical protein